MYSIRQIADKKHQFWTSFGRYMKPVPAAGHEKVHWSNYKTGVKDIFFRLDAGRERATISIELSSADFGSKNSQCRQFELLRSTFIEINGSEWIWINMKINDVTGNLSMIRKELHGVDIMKESDWPAMISFFKESMIRLDKFWTDYQDVFGMTDG